MGFLLRSFACTAFPVICNHGFPLRKNLHGSYRARVRCFRDGFCCARWSLAILRLRLSFAARRAPLIIIRPEI